MSDLMSIAILDQAESNYDYLQEMFKAIGVRTKSVWDDSTDFSGFRGTNLFWDDEVSATYESVEGYINYYKLHSNVSWGTATPSKITANIDFTGASELNVKWKLETSDTMSTNSAQIKIDSTTKADETATFATKTTTIDVSAITGVKELEINSGCGDGTSTKRGYVYVYSIDLDGTTILMSDGAAITGDTITLDTGQTSATIYSPELTPTDLREWDTAIFNVVDNDGSSQLNILDDSATELVSDVADEQSIDTATAGELTLQYEIELSRTLAGDSSPVVYNLGFTYL